MQLDWETLQYALALPIGWVLKIIWNNHKSIAELREEIARDYVTSKEVDDRIKDCSDSKDAFLREQKEDLEYIRDRVDKIVDRMLDKRQ